MRIIQHFILILYASFSLFTARSQTLELISPQLSSNNKVYDFGEVPHGSECEGIVVIRNSGNRTLLITDVATSGCCIDYSLDVSEIAPNDSTFLRLFPSTHTYPGATSKRIEIHSNAIDSAVSVLDVNLVILPNPNATPDPNKAKVNSTFYKIQYEYGNFHSLSASFGLYKFNEDIVLMSYSGFYGNIGLGLFDERNMMINQLGFEYNYLVLTGGMGLIHITDFQQSQLCLRPEIGLSLFGKLTLTYGYSLNIANGFQNRDYRGHYLTLNVGILWPFKKYR